MSLISAIRSLAQSNFSEDIWVLPQPLSHYPDLVSDDFSPFDLPSVLVPPEVFEMDTLELGGTMYEENQSTTKKEELPRFYLSLFDNEVSSSLGLASSILTLSYRLHPTLQRLLDISFVLY